MENNRSLLKESSIEITPKLSVRIPTVGEILEDEKSYYTLINSLTATPFQYMVQLDDMGIDFTTINDYQLFLLIFPSFAKTDMSILFGNIDFSDIEVKTNTQNDSAILHSEKNDIIIDELVYSEIVKAIRKINGLQRENRKPGNDEAKEFRINLERKKQKRNARKPYDP